MEEENCVVIQYQPACQGVFLVEEGKDIFD